MWVSDTIQSDRLVVNSHDGDIKSVGYDTPSQSPYLFLYICLISLAYDPIPHSDRYKIHHQTKALLHIKLLLQ